MIRGLIIWLLLWAVGANAATEEETRCNTLIAMVRAGTTAAFSEFTQIVEGRLKQRILFRGISRDDVDDVVQDTYLMLLAKPQTPEDDNSVIAYLMGLADTACKRHLGTNGKEIVALLPSEGLTDVAATPQSAPEEQRSPLANWPTDETELFHTSLFAKPERQLLMMADRGRPLTEIREALGLPANYAAIAWRIKTLQRVRQLAFEQLGRNLPVVFSRTELQDIAQHFTTGQAINESLSSELSELISTSAQNSPYPLPRTVMNTIRHHSFKPHVATALELRAISPWITLAEIVEKGNMPFGDNFLLRELPGWQQEEQAAVEKALALLRLRFNQVESEILRKFYAGASLSRLHREYGENGGLEATQALLESLHQRFLVILREPGIVQPNAGHFVYTPERELVVRSGHRRGFEDMFRQWVTDDLNRNFYRRSQAGEPLVDIGRSQNPVMTGQTVNKRVIRTSRVVDAQLGALDFRLSLAFSDDELHMLRLREQGASAQRIYEMRSPLYSEAKSPPLFEELIRRLEQRYDAITRNQFDFSSLPIPTPERELLYAALFSDRDHYILYLDEWGFTPAEIVRALQERSLGAPGLTQQLQTLKVRKEEALRRAMALPLRLFSEGERQILSDAFAGNPPHPSFVRLRLHYRLMLSAGAWSGLQLRPEREMAAIAKGIFGDEERKILELSDSGKPVRSILTIMKLSCSERALFKRLASLNALRDGALEEGNSLMDSLFTEPDAIRILELYWAKATLAEISSLLGYSDNSETIGARIDQYRDKLSAVLEQRSRVDPRHPLYYLDGKNDPIPTYWGVQVEPYLTRVNADDQQLFRFSGAGVTHERIQELVPALKARFASLKTQRNQLSLIRGRITEEMTREIPTKLSELLSMQQLRTVLTGVRGDVNERELNLLLLGDRRVTAEEIRSTLGVDWDDPYLWSRYAFVRGRAYSRALELKLIQP